jgi:hypothetical protein
MFVDERLGDCDRIAAVRVLANKATDLFGGCAPLLPRRYDRGWRGRWRRRGLRIWVEGDYIHDVLTFCPPSSGGLLFCGADPAPHRDTSSRLSSARSGLRPLVRLRLLVMVGVGGIEHCRAASRARVGLARVQPAASRADVAKEATKSSASLM